MIDDALCALCGTRCVGHQWWKTIIFPEFSCGFTLFANTFYGKQRPQVTLNLSESN